MQIKAYGAESWLFPNSCGGADKAELHTARNSYANVQLKVENLKKALSGRSNLREAPLRI